jgi:hypothetical protein
MSAPKIVIHNHFSRSARDTQRPNAAARDATERGLEDNQPRVVEGVQGVKSKPFSKRFPNAAAMERWMDSEEYGDYTVHVIKKA